MEPPGTTSPSRPAHPRAPLSASLAAGEVSARAAPGEQGFRAPRADPYHGRGPAEAGSTGADSQPPPPPPTGPPLPGAASAAARSPPAPARALPPPRLRACSVTVPGAGLQARPAPQLFEYANERPGVNQ